VRDVTPTGPRSDHDIRQAATNGSRDLCAAILATGKTHGPMTEAQQIAAVKYAHRINYVDGIRVQSKRDKQT
jgi:hypothetical protein